MATKNKNNLKSETILVVVGSLLLIIAFVLFHYSLILEVNSDIYNTIQAEIFKEKNGNNKISVNVSVDYINTDKDLGDKEENSSTINYIAFLEIEKINLMQGLLPKSSYYNNVDYHVEILDISDFPDVINGNFILAGHSGTSNVAFFKNLYKLKIGDNAKIYYQNKVYSYNIVNIYNENKDGSVNIYRDSNKTTLTLITCTENDKTKQTIYILELVGVETY